MNIRGLCPKSNRTKVSYLSDLATESNAPFIALQETHLFQDILDAEVQISGQTLYRSDRLGGRTHGGVAVYVRDDLTVRELFKYSNNCCESIIVEIKELELILITVWRPPNSPKQLFQETLDKCQEIINSEIENETVHKSRTLLVLGDFNFPFIKWPNKRIYLRDEEPENMSSEKTQGKMLLEWAEQNFLEQYIYSPTRKGNTIDLVFTNLVSLINGYSTIININFSDHNILRLHLNIAYRSQDRKKKKINPYPNTMYEYDLINASKEDWIRYETLQKTLMKKQKMKTQQKD